MKIKFCGAAEGITGSCHLIETETCKFLLDCGMFQGSKKNEEQNREAFPFDISDIDFVLLSHVHVDHSGRIPLLVKRGYSNPIYCTDASADLLDIMLKDCAYIQERETEYRNKKADRLGLKHIEPLYDTDDVEKALELRVPTLYDSIRVINDTVSVRFVEAGHILGSASIEIWIKENGKTTKIVFSGDIGVSDRPILRDPVYIKEADVVIMETTYGNRMHPKNDKDVGDLKEAVMKTVKRGGSVIIPAFAVGRTQDIIYHFNKLFAEDAEFAKFMKDIPFYVDSPMAKAATEILKRNAQVFDEEARSQLISGDNPVNFKNLKFVETVAESQTINENRTPKVIISASGMCEAGRIKHHLKHNLWDARNSVIFVGYQAEGTLGRKLTDGQKTVHIFGEPIVVAAEIYDLKGFSAHADQKGLLNWISAFNPTPSKIFLVHGEKLSKSDFAALIKHNLEVEPIVVNEICSVDFNEGELHVQDYKKQSVEARRYEELVNMRRKLADVHHNLEHILYTTELAATDNLTDDKIRNLNDIILELEKNSLNLGSKVTDINENSESPHKE